MCAADVGVLPNIFHDFPTSHPINDYLMRMGRSPETLDNIRMLQPHPEGDLLIERLKTINCVNGPSPKESNSPTFSFSFRSFPPPLTVTLIALRQTFLRLKLSSTSSPFHTSAKPPEANSFACFLDTPSESRYDLGSTPRLLQMLHNACKTCWNKFVLKLSSLSN